MWCGGLSSCNQQVHVLNGEKYKEVCPDNTLLNNMQLRGCIIQPNAKKPLLKRESALGSVSEEIRIFLPVEVSSSITALAVARAPELQHSSQHVQGSQCWQQLQCCRMGHSIPGVKCCMITSLANGPHCELPHIDFMQPVFFC
jgi:hypothetical protein